ncbi:GntR family transcriptional regulator [Mycobacterium sp. NPDC003449]
MTQFDLGVPTRLTLRESVVDHLRSAISDGSIAPGTHLGEVDLSTSMKVSRATLREALRQLQQEGLLTQDSRGRVSVRKVSPSEVDDIFEVRLGLESIAVRRLCTRQDRAADVRVIRSKLERLREPLSLADDMDADLDFHGTICAQAGNAALVQAWTSISGVIRITMIAAGDAPARANASYHRHVPIVDFIEAGDASGALSFLHEHMSSAAEQLIARMT